MDLSNTPGTPFANIEKELVETIDASPLDIYYVGLSRLNFSKAQVAANANAGIP